MQKEYYKYCFNRVEKYNIKMADMLCILFLHNNHPLDTARDIVHHQKMSPGMVSKSIEELKNYGYIKAFRDEKDSRYIHLKLTEKTENIVKDLDNAQEEFILKLTENIKKESLAEMTKVAIKMSENLENNIIKGE